MLLDGGPQEGAEARWVDGGVASPVRILHTGLMAGAGSVGVGVTYLVGAGIIARRKAKRTLKPEGHLEMLRSGAV